MCEVHHSIGGKSVKDSSGQFKDVFGVEMGQ